MRRCIAFIVCCLTYAVMQAQDTGSFPSISTTPQAGYFPLSSDKASTVYVDENDFKVVEIAAGMLSDDIGRVTGKKTESIVTDSHRKISADAAVVAGTLGQSALVEWIVKRNGIDVSSIEGKWETFLIATTRHPKYGTPVLAVIGSDRRGTAYGLTSLSEAIGVSPWYWWADVTPAKRKALYLEPGCFCQGEPSVQYRGIFINDERFGGWARWAEQTFDKESGKVGPKTYEKVFELLLRLKANYLWPAMHNGSAAFNSNPENARLADDYAIVMGSSHCEQMLRNNEDEWKNVGTYGDFNYITNRQTMMDYWEERVRTNGKYENTYTLGLRGIHDYPMEGAKTTSERVRLMQQAIDDQRAILDRNIDRPLKEIPQVLCTYEEVLEAYHNGLQVPEDVTLLWADDKHGYCRNLSNPQEQQRKGGAGIYYHLSYHGDPASWIWLSPLSPSFISTELTKAYGFGVRNIWVFNVGDIKPAEKEISFAMDLAWDIDRWSPEKAHTYIRDWASKTFGEAYADEIAEMQEDYYRLQAAGKDSHVWFVNYTEKQIEERIRTWKDIASRAEALSASIPSELQDAYFELISYPICGAAMLNEHQILARRSMVRAAFRDFEGAEQDARRVKETFDSLNSWTDRYNNEICDGKWGEFFNWQPYHWYRSEKIGPAFYTREVHDLAVNAPDARFLPVDEALSGDGVVIECEGDAEVPLWIEALSPVRNFSKAPEDNVFCHVTAGQDSFDASATPINNIWHSPHIGPMWSKVGTLHLKEGCNTLNISDLKDGAHIYRIFLGVWPPFNEEPRLRINASDYIRKQDNKDGSILTIKGLGYSDGVLVRPFTTPSYGPEADAPSVEYEIELKEGDSTIEIRTLPTLHVYEGRNAGYSVQIGDNDPEVFSIHAGDFTAEWRYNVLHGYSSRSVRVPSGCTGLQKVRIRFLDPGIVLQEILVHQAGVILQ